MFWMTALLGMVVMGSLDFFSAEPIDETDVDDDTIDNNLDMLAPENQWDAPLLDHSIANFSAPQTFTSTGSEPLRGSDTVYRLIGHDGTDRLHSNAGNDALTGGLGQDVIFGGRVDDRIDGTENGQDTTENSAVDQQDFLSGGEGNDTLLAGAGDVVTPGLGQEIVILDSENAGKTAANIIGFDRQLDKILITYPAAAQEIHVVSLRPNEDNPALTQILVDASVLP